MKELANKIAVIAGCNNGSGLATAQLFANEGAKVAIATDDQTAVCDAIESIGNGAMGLTSDLADLDSVRKLYENVTIYFSGKIDVLIINAGSFDTELQDASTILDALNSSKGNLRYVLSAAENALPFLANHAIVFITYFPYGLLSEGFQSSVFQNRKKTLRTQSGDGEHGKLINFYLLLPGVTYRSITTVTNPNLQFAKLLVDKNGEWQRGSDQHGIAESILKIVNSNSF